ncbi:MAG TPA: chemotaxis-specific protein-glutamate methyltransferase CheB [bacterium (Candidatus Stahlbacteria)]|nr:chemotaxis-specific protein-glutamate methyltransferase CheB [Candidatus Stahlbacteria bacterium]
MKRVLVVDDSMLMVKVISDIINSIEDFKVCATAQSAEEAVDKILTYKPDLVTLDFELPDHNGLWVLERVFEHQWFPVLMVSAHTKDGADITLRCLELGAVDFITKPSGMISLDLDRAQFKDKINLAISARYRAEKIEISETEWGKDFYCIGIGSSTGGVRALTAIVPSFPAELPGSILIVQHMPKEFTRSFAERLDRKSPIKVVEAKGNDDIHPGMAFIAPGGYHMTVRSKRIVITKDPPIWGVRPAVDYLLPGIAANFQESSLGVIITGMGKDGVRGVKVIKDCGGKNIAEDPDTAFISSMPRNAIKTGCIDFVLPLSKIPEKILELTT